MIYTNPIYLLKTGCHLKKETNYKNTPIKIGVISEKTHNFAPNNR